MEKTAQLVIKEEKILDSNKNAIRDYTDMPKRQQSLRVVELFAGVGGFRLGLERASGNKFKTIWANQWEPNKSQNSQFAYQCYAKNFFDEAILNNGVETTIITKEDCELVNEDLNKVKHEVPEHDLLVGGFPCQDYSVARTGAKGIEGKKGVLWWDIYDILKFRTPKFLLLENVDRLLKSPTNQRGRDFGIMLKCLNDIGYVVEWRVINAADYGHAQRRRRTFIFGARKDSGFAEKTEKLSHREVLHSEGFFADNFKVEDEIKAQRNYDLGSYDNVKNVSDKFAATFENSGFMGLNGKITTINIKPSSVNSTLLKDILSRTTEDIHERFYINGSLEKWEFLKGAKKLTRKSKSGHSYTYAEGGMAFPENLNLPSRTMLTSEGTLNRSTHVILDDKSKRLRILTPEECEDLNEFPRGWTNTGMPERWRYFTMGNALVVGVVEKLGKTLMKIID